MSGRTGEIQIDTSGHESLLRDDESISRAVTRLVATATGVDPLDLPPLYDAVDPEALETLASSEGTVGTVEFLYADHAVTIDLDGSIVVSAADEFEERNDAR